MSTTCSGICGASTCQSADRSSRLLRRTSGFDPVLTSRVQHPVAPMLVSIDSSGWLRSDRSALPLASHARNAANLRLADPMAKKLTEGTEAVGHIDGLDSELSSGYLKLDSRGALVSLPKIGSAGELFTAVLGDDREEVPRHLRFVSTNVTVLLGECRASGGSVSMDGTGVSRVRARRIVRADGGTVDYADVDGMESEIDGLAKWSGMSTVTHEVRTEPFAVVLRAENQETVELGGGANAAIVSAFSYNPSPRGNVFCITDVARLQTSSVELWPWQQHAAVHHMFQDLMCLVYGRPCLSQVTSAKREDDQPYILDDGRSLWREVYEPTFGRSVEGIEPLDRAKDEPLFYLRDVDRVALTKWIDEWDLWSRPTWIAVTTMFQRGTTVEARLLQVGVALEALGYALWKEAPQTGSAKGPQGKRSTPGYAGLLQRVVDATQVVHPKICGSETPDEWRKSFYAAFKGIKHADNPLPDCSKARRYADQGMNLIRTWLGVRLGVDRATLVERLGRR